jgi:hypothetical protein
VLSFRSTQELFEQVMGDGRMGLISMTNTTHISRFCSMTSVEYLITDPNGIYIDGTLGGGGHSARFWKNFPAATLYGD